LLRARIAIATAQVRLHRAPGKCRAALAMSRRHSAPRAFSDDDRQDRA
jgi:hypothetical protein